MHDCPECGEACYCDGEDHLNTSTLDCIHACDTCDDDPGPVECRCGRVAIMEACEQCGAPLCSMCFETGAGFCEKHPDEDYAPPQGTHDAGE